MQFTPKTEAEATATKSKFGPLPDGVYPFTVLESSEQASKSQKNFGRIMVKLKLAIHTREGRDQWVWDYFADWFSEWKLKHFCESTGQAELYNSGAVEFADNAQQGSQGYVRLFTEVSNDGKERNAADDYEVKQAGATVDDARAQKGFAQVKAAVDRHESDDVPF